MSTRLHEVIDKWNLLESIERLDKHPQDNCKKDPDGNLPLHKLLGHANANDEYLERKTKRVHDRPPFFKLLRKMLTIANGSLQKKDAIKIHNNKGKLPSELLNGRVSVSVGDQAETIEAEAIEWLKEVEERALQLDTSRSTVENTVDQEKQCAFADDTQQAASKCVRQKTKNKPPKESAVDLEVVPSAQRPSPNSLQTTMDYSQEAIQFVKKASEQAQNDLHTKQKALKQAQDEVKKLNTELKQAQDNIKTTGEALRQSKSNENALKQKIEKKGLKFAQMKANTKKKIEKLEAELDLSKKRNLELRAEVEKSKVELVASQQEIESTKADKETELGRFRKEIEKLKAESRLSKKTMEELNAALKTNAEHCETKIDSIQEELDACMLRKQEMKKEHKKEMQVVAEQDHIIDRLTDEVTSQYDGAQDDKGRNLTPSELSMLLQRSFGKRHCWPQWILLKKVLKRANADTTPKRESLIEDLPQLMKTVVDTNEEDHLVTVARHLISFLKSIAFSDTQEHAENAKKILSNESYSVSGLKDMCMQLASDCKLHLMQTVEKTDCTLSDISVSTNAGDDHTILNENNNRAVRSPPPVDSEREKRGRDTSSLDASTLTDSGPPRKQQK